MESDDNMYIENVTLTNFRCFGSSPQTICLSSGVTCLIGANGAGKTALMLALLRMFGISSEQRRFRRRDFHVPAGETKAPTERSLSIDVILAFPEVSEDDGGESDAVPQFFQQMAASEDALKCRLRLEATWSDDGSIDGAIAENFYVIKTLGPGFTDEERTQLKAGDRTRVQIIYVPAVRDGSAHVAAFLRGRLWRAITWSQTLQDTLKNIGTTLNDTFDKEEAVTKITDALKQRWGQVHDAGINAAPAFRPIDTRLQEFIRKVEVVFRPNEEGRDAGIDELSDGQRSLLHIAMTAAALDVESQIKKNPASCSFNADKIPFPALTLLAVEEPENNLSPFYLSRIITQIKNLTTSGAAQAIVSSHSASILGRVSPDDVRYFKLDPQTRTALVKEILLPTNEEEAEKYVREAVRAYPELYFAQFVILGEGSSEEVVIPRIAEAMKLPIDRSFVAIVPLGGRHVNHLWRLLTDLDIPFATLLDLDYGRAGGGWDRIKYVCEHLIEVGVFPLPDVDARDTPMTYAAKLRSVGVFFCEPLDLDMCMLAQYSEYQLLAPGMRGPKPTSSTRAAVLGDDGDPTLYNQAWDNLLNWYRYLFLWRGKPSTHARVLGGMSPQTLAKRAPEPLKALLHFVKDKLPAFPVDDTTNGGA